VGVALLLVEVDEAVVDERMLEGLDEEEGVILAPEETR